jgi:pyroglutamyl-peptidase
MPGGPRLLITGFGPFPGAPENPTALLVEALSGRPASDFGARKFQAIVLPTEYQRSWVMLGQVYASFDPDVVVHFGLNASAQALYIETVARNSLDAAMPDAKGWAPSSSNVRRAGAATLPSTLPNETIIAALRGKGVRARLSDDAGRYVCNATLYRSLHAAPITRRVGFIHVPSIRRLRCRGC